MKFTSEDLLKAMGLKVGDRIWLKSRNLNFIVCFSDWSKKAFLRNDNVCDIYLCDVVDEEYEIIQPKPTLTEDEKVILRNLTEGFKWIARDKGGTYIRIFSHKPKISNNKKEWYTDYFCSTLPFAHLFQFIKWEDEPYSIEELLKE